MNSNVMPSRVQMDPVLLQQLVAEVKETIATGIKKQQNAAHSFKAINLWNIQRKGKYVNGGTKRTKNLYLSATHVTF
ncbi:MAG: hypothetical protein ABI813_11040 [Bacteroidota bacterium]